MPAFCRPPSQSTTQIEYLFLAVNSAKQVVRSQTFTVTKNPAKGIPDWQEVPKEGEIKVSMEVGQPTKELPGFSDNVTVDMVESGARFGVVALLYYELTDDGSSKAAAGQTGAGTTAGSASSAAAGGAVSSSSAVAAATAAHRRHIRRRHYRRRRGLVHGCHCRPGGGRRRSGWRDSRCRK